MIVTGIDKKIETALIEKFDVSSIEQGILDRFIPAKTPDTPIVSPVSTNPDIKKDTKNMNISSVSLNVANPTQAPEIPASLTNWINSNPLTMASLK